MITLDNRSGMGTSYATLDSAGFDIRANEHKEIPPGATVVVCTGLYIKKADRWDFMQVCPRSGLASRGLFAIVGIIDNDYLGEIKVVFYNSTRSHYTITRGDRIAQGIAGVYHHVMNVDIDELVRGKEGFGATERRKFLKLQPNEDVPEGNEVEE